MADIEKVIKGLECCSEKQNCKDCPYFRFNASCQDDMNKDALELLKEQHGRIALMKFIYGDQGEIVGEIIRCKDCENFVWNSISQNAGSCGIGIGDGRNNWHSKEWFCANGKRKQTD